jgi:hypothetical protein
MNLSSTTQRMTRPLLTVAAILVSAAFAIWGSKGGVAAAVGAGVGLGNWFALRWLMSRLASAGNSQRAVISLLLVAKIGLLMAIVFVLISSVKLDPIGLAFGLSVLFLGPVIAGLLIAATGAEPDAAISSPSAVREER